MASKNPDKHPMTRNRSDLESLASNAVNLLAKKHKIKDPLLVDIACDTRRTTEDPIYRFRIVSIGNANGPQHQIVLSSSGAELSLAEIIKQDGVTYFPAAAGGAPAPAVPVAVTINPTENKLELNQGDTNTETITVTVPPNAAVVKADIYFLADTTGSMTSILNAVKAGAATILNSLNGLGLDFAYGVGNYKDFPIGPGANPYAFQHQVSPTSVVAAVTTGISTWNASDGIDTPEGQLYAFHKLAVPPGGAIGWRTGSKRIIVWFGDAPGHDPVCKAISAEPSDVTQTSATVQLVNEKITVLAISTSSPGLDDDPKSGATSYNVVCGAPGGNPGQGTKIANATGGKFVSPINAANIVQTIIDLVKGAIAGINNVTLVPSGAIVPFVTSITPAAGYGPLSSDKESKLTFQVTFTGTVPCKDDPQIFTGTLDVVADGVVVAQKRVEITVPTCKSEIFLSYSVKFVCGVQPDCGCDCAPVRPGAYATEINIYNHTSKEVIIRKLVVPVVLAGAPAGREPRAAARRAEDKLVLPPHSATMDDCCRIAELLFGVAPRSPSPLTVGFLEIISPVELSVTAVYTATGLNSGSISMDVEQIQPNLIQARQR